MTEATESHAATHVKEQTMQATFGMLFISIACLLEG